MKFGENPTLSRNGKQEFVSPISSQTIIKMNIRSPRQRMNK